MASLPWDPLQVIIETNSMWFFPPDGAPRLDKPTVEEERIA